ncbi:MAG: hypothetical protein H7289_00140 [Mucilaginibacter sp.]|nr:hypothetical protein [Mucilaginibacter sp.]
MKKSVSLLVLLFLLMDSVLAQNNNADFFKETYRKGFVTNLGDTSKYQKIFFDAFPSNFKDLKKLYGWNEQTNTGRPLTNIPATYFSRFFEIKSVSHKALTKKIIDVSVNAKWYADAIARFQLDAFKYAITYNKEFIGQLQARSKADIISVWTFYFDYVNPIYRKNAYDKIVKATAPNSKKMVSLITAGYKNAAAKWRTH